MFGIFEDYFPFPVWWDMLVSSLEGIYIYEIPFKSTMEITHTHKKTRLFSAPKCDCYSSCGWPHSTKGRWMAGSYSHPPNLDGKGQSWIWTIPTSRLDYISCSSRIPLIFEGCTTPIFGQISRSWFSYVCPCMTDEEMNAQDSTYTGQVTLLVQLQHRTRTFSWSVEVLATSQTTNAPSRSWGTAGETFNKKYPWSEWHSKVIMWKKNRAQFTAPV